LPRLKPADGVCQSPEQRRMILVCKRLLGIRSEQRKQGKLALAVHKVLQTDRFALLRS
jgi:hypothetical protein